MEKLMEVARKRRPTLRKRVCNSQENPLISPELCSKEIKGSEKGFEESASQLLHGSRWAENCCPTDPSLLLQQAAETYGILGNVVMLLKLIGRLLLRVGPQSNAAACFTAVSDPGRRSGTL